MKISFITTVFNEEATVEALLESIIRQSRMPDEVIIVDGGSTDATASIISNFTKTFTSEESKSLLRHHPRWKTITKKGNRAVGRNEAIRQASGDVIVSSDAGCVLDKDWVKNITEPFKNKDVDVVAGYYKGMPRTIFQKCLVPYVLVMPDKVDPQNFLPASRSMAFTKKIWEKAGGFPEKYSSNEDFVFAKRLKEISAKIVFAKDAILYWMPRKNLKEAFAMFFRFAYGDAQAGILRPKVFLIFLRYFLGVLLLLSYINAFYVVVILYTVWSIWKNYRYAKKWQAIFILPILQIVSDMAVLLGTIWGIQNKR
ncbi:MAG: glycosyltransferase [Candidatus Levybacteria bacterium]|nr:glycosyltransferase [Candidatus Levybacteria bacterium]